MEMHHPAWLGSSRLSRESSSFFETYFFSYTRMALVFVSSGSINTLDTCENLSREGILVSFYDLVLTMEIPEAQSGSLR